jgi:hypothetical protein
MCWFCGSPITDADPIGRSLRCPECGKDLRSCRNCRFFLAGSRGDCKESQADIVADKERGNFCDWFSLDPKRRQKTAGEGKAGDAAVSAREAFNSLFK